MIGNLKAGFHLISTLSWSWSLNHKHTAIGSNEYQSDQIGRKIILPLTTRLLTIQWKLSCQSHKWKNVPQGPENWHCDLLVFPFLLATDNLFHWIKSDRGRSGIGRKCNSFDPSEYDSVELMTLLLTLIFSFHSVGSILQLHLFFFSIGTNWPWPNWMRNILPLQLLLTKCQLNVTQLLDLWSKFSIERILSNVVGTTSQVNFNLKTR